jgi:hypothetical protein
MEPCLSDGTSIPPPRRPKESHLQPPTEPCLSLSTYTARPSRSLALLRGPIDAEGECSSQLPAWQEPFFELSHPLRSNPLQKLQRYYWMIRPLRVHRYFPVSWSALIEFWLNITQREFPSSQVQRWLDDFSRTLEADSKDKLPDHLIAPGFYPPLKCS